MIPSPEPKPSDGHAAVRAALVELRQGPVTALDLARQSRIDESRTADPLGKLERCRAVCRADGEVGGADDYALTASQPLVLGVDLGGTKIHVALADLAGTDWRPLVAGIGNPGVVDVPSGRLDLSVLAENLEMTDPRGGVHVLDQTAALAERTAQAAGAADSGF